MNDRLVDNEDDGVRKSYLVCEQCTICDSLVFFDFTDLGLYN